MGILKPIKTNKKGQTDLLGLFFAMTVLFGVAIFALILFNAYDGNIKGKLGEALTSSTDIDSNANVTKILEQTSGGISMLNPLFPLLVVGVFGYVIMLVFLSKSHPALFFIGILVLGIVLILAATFSNIYEGIAGTAQFADAASEFGIIDIMMGNLPMMIFILFIGVSIILYGMRQGPPRGGTY